MVYDSNCGNPHSFFHYKGKYYLTGTIVTLTDEYIRKTKYNNQPLWKYYAFTRQVNHNGRLGYKFCQVKRRWFDCYQMNVDVSVVHQCAPWFIVYASDLDKMIETIYHEELMPEAHVQAINTYIENV